MSSQAEFGFKNKISSVIGNYLPSKYNASKWIGANGSNSVRVDKNYNNFSEAVEDC